LDLRGRGLSEDSGPGTYGWPSHAEDAAQAAALLGADHYSLVGWSMGAFVAMELARRRPEQVERLVLVDAAGPADQVVERLVRASAERLGAAYASADAFLELVRGLGTIEPWDEFWDAYFMYDLVEGPGGVRPRTSRVAVMEDLEYGAGHDPAEFWPRLTMPVLLVRATRPMHPQLGGHLVNDEQVARFRATVPHAQVVDVDANHYTVATVPAALESIVSFLSR
ncbi:MAG: alpha/beta hydrolase, partial [Candidatus Dormibacteraeota bacterium]|nr:alpha/beta hydrolase [Candidatus Dormibacteraeota bacterium]